MSSFGSQVGVGIDLRLQTESIAEEARKGKEEFQQVMSGSPITVPIQFDTASIETSVANLREQCAAQPPLIFPATFSMQPSGYGGGPATMHLGDASMVVLNAFGERVSSPDWGPMSSGGAFGMEALAAPAVAGFAEREARLAAMNAAAAAAQTAAPGMNQWGGIGTLPYGPEEMPINGPDSGPTDWNTGNWTPMMVGGGGGGGGGSFNRGGMTGGMGAFRSLIMAKMAIEGVAGVEQLGEGLIKDYQGFSGSSSKGLESYLKSTSGQTHMGMIGDLIGKYIGDPIYSGISSTKNLFEGQGFESDQTYAQTVEGEVKVQEATEKHLETEIARQKRTNASLDLMTSRSKDATDAVGLTGSSRIWADSRRQDADLAAEIRDDAKFHMAGDISKPITASAQAYERAKQDEINATRDHNLQIQADKDNESRLKNQRELFSDSDASLARISAEDDAIRAGNPFVARDLEIQQQMDVMHNEVRINRPGETEAQIQAAIADYDKYNPQYKALVAKKASNAKDASAKDLSDEIDDDLYDYKQLMKGGKILTADQNASADIKTEIAATAYTKIGDIYDADVERFKASEQKKIDEFKKNHETMAAALEQTYENAQLDAMAAEHVQARENRLFGASVSMQEARPFGRAQAQYMTQLHDYQDAMRSAGGNVDDQNAARTILERQLYTDLHSGDYGGSARGQISAMEGRLMTSDRLMADVGRHPQAGSSAELNEWREIGADLRSLGLAGIVGPEKGMTDAQLGRKYEQDVESGKMTSQIMAVTGKNVQADLNTALTKLATILQNAVGIGIIKRN